ncbi:MAG TPA: FecR domain-containing protein [Bacteroidales bacterium]|nr:FecR domain-containing protein [Bacteroidales bacterium]
MKEEIKNIFFDKATQEERDDFFFKLQEDLKNESELKETHVLSVLHSMVSLKTSDLNKEKRFNTFWGTAKSRQEKLRKLSIIGQAAAIIILVLLSANLLYAEINRTESYVLRSERGSISSVEIEEGTEIWLNTSSSAEVIKKGDKEIIVLLEGEGYFEVEHNPEREFIVKAADFQIRDIGTAFNIKAYPDDNELLVSVYEGEAQFETSDNNILKNLYGGEGLKVDLETGMRTPRLSDYMADTDWKEGKFAFEQVPFSDILDEFEEWYDVDFVINNNSLKDQLFTGVLKRKSSINNLMLILKMTSDFEYNIELNNDGSSLVLIY